MENTWTIRWLATLWIITGLTNISSSQETIHHTQGETKFLITGNAQATFSTNKDENQFGDLAFKPIFLWSLSDRLFIESEIEIATGEGSVEVVLEYANMAYRINKYLTFHAGRFLPKFGGYWGRLGEGFLNRFSTDPAGFGDGGIGPRIEMGAGLQGGAQLGKSKVNYDFYIADGPQLLIGSVDAPDEAGQMQYEPYVDNNKNKAIGGRIGFLPIPSSTLELGISFEHAGQTGDQQTEFQKTPANMYALDLNYYQMINPINSILRINGEWKKMEVGDVNYPNIETETGTYTFHNASSAYYAQASLRPTGATKTWLNNTELSVRFSRFNTPDGALWSGSNRTDLGIDYWLKWNAVFKLGYEIETDLPSTLFTQLVYGF
ncbi:MAG: hypothetical protein KDC57_11950 [Saprospiraceae bacterium]|nr:hypothetical protein [Saprospiraceae bacterium]